MFDINVLGLLLITQAAAAHQSEGGSIINIGSAVTASRRRNPRLHRHQGRGGRHHRRASQRAWPQKIRVNTISPSLTETEGTHSAGFVASDFETASSPRPPRSPWPAADIADVVAFVASDDSGWLTGEKILAGGGLR